MDQAYAIQQKVKNMESPCSSRSSGQDDECNQVNNCVRMRKFVFVYYMYVYVYVARAAKRCYLITYFN